MLDKEAVARGICRAAYIHRDEPSPSLEEFWQAHKELYMFEGYAAIRAVTEGLMDSSPEMCKAAGHTFGTDGGWLEKHRNAIRAEQRRVLGDEG